MVDLDSLESVAEAVELRSLLEEHVQWTESDVAAALIQNWDEAVSRFIKVMPRDYKRVLAEREPQDLTAQSGTEYKNPPQHQTG
jgi:glutamate synthase domain-containing protein 3